MTLKFFWQVANIGVVHLKAEQISKFLYLQVLIDLFFFFLSRSYFDIVQAHKVFFIF